MKVKKEYALFKGAQMVAIGTAKQIADDRGLKVNTVLFYKTPAYKKRINEKNKDKRLLLVPLDE